jgi:hypothetical protein
MDNRTNVQKKYEIIGYKDNGDEIRLYADGAKRNQLGRLLELPSDLENHLITSDNAHLRLAQRKQKILDAIEKEVMTVTRVNVPAEAIGRIVGKRAEIAMKDDTRTGNEAAKIVLQAMDAYQAKEQVSTNVLRNEITIDDNTRLLLERLAQAKRQADDGIVDV